LRDNANEHFHIPPEILGILQNSNRSTIDSAEYLLNKNVLADYLRMFERVINSQLLWEDFDREHNFILAHENNIAEDIVQKLQIVNDGLARGALTVNDWRLAMGFERDERSGDVYLRSMGQSEVPFNSDMIELPDTAEPHAENPADKAPEKTLEIKHFKVLKSDADKERRVKLWKTFDARAASIEEPFVKSMNKAFTKQNELVDKAIREAVENNKDVGTAIENLYDKNMDDQLKHTLAGAFLNGLAVGVSHGQELLNKKSMPEISENVRRLLNLWIDNYGLELCKDINNTTKKKLRKALSESITEGEDLRNQVEKLIEVADGLFDDDKKVRATLIARTESCTTMNAGSNELYKAEGINYKEWISVQDDRTRDSHLIMDGTVIPITDKFEVPAMDNVDGAYMEYAGDPSAPAGQVVNCRCTISPVVMM
jgi:SPP1 gp7 family putative phage head morphogenesis protein